MIVINNTADKIITELLDRIDKTYTEQRKAKIRSRMNAFWDGEYPADRMPYTILDLAFDLEIPESITGFDRELILQLHSIAKHGEIYDDEYYPALTPGVRQVVLPSYFGCIEEHASDSVKVKSIISEPEDVYTLPEVGFTKESAGGEMLEKIRYWREKTNGRIAFYIADMQGPFSVASQVYGIEEFLFSCYENPEEVHHLINKCTDVFIKFMDEMFNIVGEDLVTIHSLPCLYLSQEKGIAFSEDLVAVISPGIVKEFINPYAERIAKKYKGIVIHTCGAMNYVIDALMEIPGLIGVNFSTCETDLEDMAEKIRDKIIIVSHNGPITTGILPLLNPLEHVEHMGNLLRKYNVNGYTIVINHVNTPEDKKFTPGMENVVRELLRA